METVEDIINSDEATSLYRRMIIASLLDAIGKVSMDTRESVGDRGQHILCKIADAIIKEVPLDFNCAICPYFNDLDGLPLLDIDGNKAAISVTFDEFEVFSVTVLQIISQGKVYTWNHGELEIANLADLPLVTPAVKVMHKFKDMVLLTGAAIVQLGNMIRSQSRTNIGIKNHPLYGIRFNNYDMLVVGIESANDELTGTLNVTLKFPDDVLETFPESKIVTEYDFDPIEVLKSVYGPNVE